MLPLALFQAGIVISVAASGESIKIILFSMFFSFSIFYRAKRAATRQLITLAPQCRF
jgi:uncharacterized RDD family membrane protein YckC